jgi:hypothetical protein
MANSQVLISRMENHGTMCTMSIDSLRPQGEKNAVDQYGASDQFLVCRRKNEEQVPWDTTILKHRSSEESDPLAVQEVLNAIRVRHPTEVTISRIRLEPSRCGECDAEEVGQREHNVLRHQTAKTGNTVVEHASSIIDIESSDLSCCSTPDLKCKRKAHLGSPSGPRGAGALG